MNEYTYEELQIGQSESFCVTVTPDMMDRFRENTGDINPMHRDAAFAQSHGFDGQIVYGMLTASFLSTLAGVYLPGKYCLIQKVETDFPRPVYVGDTLTVTGTVRDKTDAFRTIELSVMIRNGQQRPVCKGRMRLGVLK